MRVGNATRHQTISTWVIELLTILITTIALSQYLLSSLALPLWASAVILTAFGGGFATVRRYLEVKTFR